MGFRFKQFNLEDSHCAMKVGTDSIILGAMAHVNEAKSVLDIGCGCGILSLMVAQRLEGNVNIVAVEIDEDAANQARENIAASPWPKAVEVLQRDIQAFVPENTFDLIISNPPYFVASLKGDNVKRNQARHSDGLPQQQLLKAVLASLSDKGEFWLILPFDVAQDWLNNCSGLVLCFRCDISTVEGKAAKRTILAFRRWKADDKSTKNDVVKTKLAIYDRNQQYSSQFIALTRKFYLNR